MLKIVQAYLLRFSSQHSIYGEVDRTPLLHKRVSRHPDQWIRELIPTAGREFEDYTLNRPNLAFPEYSRHLPRSAERDEYPFATSQEGGNNNFRRDAVSVRLVHEMESSLQGNLIRAFYNAKNVKLKPGGAFVVLASTGNSGWWDGNGDWSKYPRS